jgi:hypothetical protein
MDLPSETRIWKPKESEVLNGSFHLEGGLNLTVLTDDGSIWLLEAEAENQLEALHPGEGQAVHVLYERDERGRPAYEITLH